ncbi:MAG: G8 domain-containing protein [Pirellulales bacterium]
MIGNFWTHLQEKFAGLLHRESMPKRRRSRAGRTIALRAEQLEQRELLSANQITYDPTTSAVSIQGTPDADNAQVWSDATHVHVSLTTAGQTDLASFAKSTVAQIRFVGADGDDRFVNTTAVATYANGGAGNDELAGGTGNDRLYGGSGDDLLVGNNGEDELFGEEGNDRLIGWDGADNLDGSAGDDVIYGGDGDDSLIGSAGADQLYGEEGHDWLSGGTENDQLDGGSGDDRLYGGDNDDLLIGNVGNDELYGEGGNDRLAGGVGNDRLDGGIGNDQMYGGAGDDLLIGSVGNDKMYGQGGSDRLMGGDGNDRLDGGSGIDRLYGDVGDDILIGSTEDDELYGEEGNDRLVGGSGNDLLDGSAGRDRLQGQAGDDVLIGGDGNDELEGDDGQDRLTGGAGNDSLNGGGGNDRLYGGLDDDVLQGGDGDDELYGESGQDLIFGESGQDQLEGGGGHDVMVGGDGADRLAGNNGNTVLIGGRGADTLLGQTGDNLLIGGTTSYDSDLAKLRELGLAWSAAAPYSMRIQLIENEAFAAHLISTETVFEDAVADSLFGGDGQDWFFLTGSVGVYIPPDVHYHVETGDEPGHDDGHNHAAPTEFDQPPELEGFELVSAMDVLNDRQQTEAIHTRLPHADDPVLQREHLTLFQLVRYDEVTHYAIHSGAWSDPTTWHDGVVPGDGARVLIPLNVAVQVDTVITTRLSTIRVDGALSFDATRNTELRADTIVVTSSGTFEMGTAATPIMPGVTAKLLIIDNGPIDRAADPFGIGRGLISHGRTSIYGAEVSSYGALENPALVGAQSLKLTAIPIGWKVGDTIVIAGTTGGTAQNEVRRIRAIGGRTVYLDKVLSFNHVSPGPEFEVHVANVTRNAVIESESPELDHRGHVMFMHNRNVSVGYAGFYRLGRTDKMQWINDPVVNADWSLEPGTGYNPRARYSVHFHRTGTSGVPAVVIGNAVVDSPGWGFVNHSSNVDMINNVAFDVHGAAFTTEVGDEIGSFRGNLAIGTSGSGESVESRQYIFDFGHRGDGFWFQGVGVTVANNIAAGNDGSAFSYYARALVENGVKKEFQSANLPDPSIANGAPTIDVGKMPVVGFENNVGYASKEGLSTWYLLEKDEQGLQNVIRDSLFWNNTLGANVVYTHQTQLSNLTMIYVQQEDEGKPPIGIRTNSLTRDIIFNNLTVQGYTTGLELPRRGYSVVNGGNFDNARDILILSGDGRNALITGFLNTPRIVMTLDMRGVIGYLGHLFLDDIVTLDFGPFHNQRLYYTQQTADTVLVTEPYSDLPLEYVGLTNQQLWDQYGIALGGAIAPNDAYTVPEIEGLIGPAP